MHNRKPPTTKRQGAVLVMAMVCLLVITAIVGTMIRGTLRNHRQLRSEKNLRQTELLLDAGIARASKRLAADPDVRNDAWVIPADAITGLGAGRVTIELSSAENQETLTVRVSAEYPAGTELSVRRSRTVQLPTQ